MNRIVTLFTFSLAVLIAAGAFAAPVSFLYSQTDATSGFGNIDPFVYNDGGGNITFGPTAMPAAVVVNPNPGLTPAGFIGAQTVAGGNSNEGNVMVGLTWSGSVTATGTRGAQTFTMQIPLRFATEVNQTPTDLNDYQWIITYGDNPASGNDVVASAIRYMALLGRDPVVDATETPNTFQRYTQLTQNLVAGPDAFTNTDTTTTAIKDATDLPNAPLGNDAAGTPLAFYFGWRDGGSLPAGRALLVNDIALGGLLDPDTTTLRLVPEPSSIVLAGIAMVAGVYWRKRQRG